MSDETPDLERFAVLRFSDEQERDEKVPTPERGMAVVVGVKPADRYFCVFSGGAWQRLGEQS